MQWHRECGRKRLSKKFADRFGSWTFTATATFWTSVFSTPLYWLGDHKFSTAGVGYLLWLILVCTIGATSLFAFASKRSRPLETSSVILLEVVVAFAVGLLMQDAQLDREKLLGVGLVIAGALLASSHPKESGAVRLDPSQDGSSSEDEEVIYPPAQSPPSTRDTAPGSTDRRHPTAK